MTTKWSEIRRNLTPEQEVRVARLKDQMAQDVAKAAELRRGDPPTIWHIDMSASQPRWRRLLRWLHAR